MQTWVGAEGGLFQILTSIFFFFSFVLTFCRAGFFLILTSKFVLDFFSFVLTFCRAGRSGEGTFADFDFQICQIGSAICFQFLCRGWVGAEKGRAIYPPPANLERRPPTPLGNRKKRKTDSGKWKLLTWGLHKHPWDGKKLEKRKEKTKTENESC